MAEIKAEKVEIGKLFSENYQFKIPNFQRPFSWKRDNFDKLFGSIYDAFVNNQDEYFLGSIILQEQDDFYYIIDGQQRLLSVAVLLAVIRDKINNQKIKEEIQDSLFQKEVVTKNKPAIARIKLWEDLTSLEDYIYKERGTEKYKNITYKDKKDPKYSLYEAIDIFLQKYNENFQNDEDAQNFVKYLFNKVYVVRISTKSLPYAIQLFNVLNTSGLPLTTADILKAVNLSEISEEERDKYSKKWRDIENDIGREEIEKVIEFIRTMKLKTKAKKSIYEEYNELIFKKSLIEKGIKFIEYLEKISNIYSKIVLNANDLKINSKYKLLIKLMKDFIPFDDWVPPLLAFYEKFENYQKNGKSINDFLFDFLINLEKKTVIEWVIGYTFTKRIQSLNEIVKIVEEESEPQNIINKVNPIKDNELKTKFKEKINSRDFYDENFAKYILLRIDLEEWDPENFSGYQGTITIEHILPQNPSKDSEWVKVFTNEERDEWTNKIGNLVLLGKRKNSKAKNYNFKRKKEVYFFREGITPFKITNELYEIDKWDIEALKQRQEKLIQRLLELYFGV